MTDQGTCGIFNCPHDAVPGVAYGLCEKHRFDKTSAQPGVMTDLILEQRAREIFISTWADSDPRMAELIRTDGFDETRLGASWCKIGIRAIKAALQPAQQPDTRDERIASQ